MALSCLKARVVRGTGLRTQRVARCIVRVRAESTSTAVSFKLRKHLEFGQALLLVGGLPELGSWDAKQAVELQWGEGDNWTMSAALPAGSALEYKYIVKRKDGLDWCPGQNKSFVLPSAASVEVLDSWDNGPSNVVLLAPLQAASPVVEASTASPTEPEAPPPATEPEAPPPPIVAAASPSTEGDGVPLEDVMATRYDNVPEAYTAVSTVENLQVSELEDAVSDSAIRLAASQYQQPPSSGFLANNIVQGVPLGAVAVGQDPITQYEEADKYQVVEVGSAAGKAASAVATETRASPTATAARSLDKMTMAELRSEVKRRGISPLGNRRELLTRLQNAGVV